MRVPFLNPDIRDSDVKRMIRSVKTGWLVYGPQAKMFEREFADFLKVKDVALVGSCTAALRLSLILAGVEDGDEVITTPFTFIATANSILMQQARPVFADIDEGTFNINPEKIDAGLKYFSISQNYFFDMSQPMAIMKTELLMELNRIHLSRHKMEYIHEYMLKNCVRPVCEINTMEDLKKANAIL